MDGGVGGSWKVECSIDDTPVDCLHLRENYDEGEAFKQDAVATTGIPLLHTCLMMSGLVLLLFVQESS